MTPASLFLKLFFFWSIIVVAITQCVHTIINGTPTASCTLPNQTVTVDSLQNVNKSVENLNINCDGGPLSFGTVLQLNHFVKRLFIRNCNCSFEDKFDEKQPSSLRSLSIQSSVAQLWTKFGKLMQLQNFTFVGNSIEIALVNQQPNKVPLPYQFSNAEPCVLKSNCFCTDNISGDGATDIYCFGATVQEIAVTVLPALARAQRLVCSVTMYNFQFLPFNDRYSELMQNISETFGNYLIPETCNKVAFRVFSCGTFNSTVDQAIWEISAVYLQFQDLNYKINTVVAIACGNVKILQALDGNHSAPLQMLQPAAITRGHAKSVILSYNNLTADDSTNHFIYPLLPNTTIESLDFSGNNLPTLLHSFMYDWSPTPLLRLDLHACNIHAIDETQNPFDLLPNLQWLNLAKNFLIYLRSEWFSVMQNLLYLDLSYNNPLFGVYFPTRAYPPIWPESLLFLNLSHTSLVDTDDPILISSQGYVWFDSSFFMGLSNLTMLDLSYTQGGISADFFRPLRSIQSLNLSMGQRFVTYNEILMTADYFAHMPSLREVNLDGALAVKNPVFEQACDLFGHVPLLNTLSVGLAAMCDDTNCVYNSTIGECSTAYTFAMWYHSSDANITLHGANDIRCVHNGTTESSVVAYLNDFSSSNRYIESIHVNKSEVVEEKAINPVVAVGQNQQGSTYTWSQIQVPLLVFFALALIILLIVLPARCLTTCSEEGKHYAKNRKSSNKANAATALHKRKTHLEHKNTLKNEFYLSTYTNGFNYVSTAVCKLEKYWWIFTILFFTSLFLNDAINLWVQFAYGDPTTVASMENSATFDQRPFTVCIPLQKRNVHFSPTDIIQLCDTTPCSTAVTDTLPIDSDILLFEYVMYRIGVQMAWEGGSLKSPYLEDATMKKLDDIVASRNLTYRQLLKTASKQTCKYMNISAHFGKRTDPKDVALNVAGCMELFDNLQYGITYYDIVAENQFCMRFPGLFSFESYTLEGFVQFVAPHLVYAPTPFIIDFSGKTYPTAIDASGTAISALLFHDNVIGMTLKNVMKSLEYYRSTGNTRRCYTDCAGQLRVPEIQSLCKCRPLMWSWLADSDESLPECTLEIYNNCSLPMLGSIVNCKTVIPCEVWDYSITVTNKGLTINNSTILRIPGVNTMHMVFQQQASQSLHDFFSNIGGVLGLWLGCSVMAAVHVGVYLVKMIALVVPWKHRREKMTANNGVADIGVQTN